MFNLSLKEEWVNNKKFCHRLNEEVESAELTQQVEKNPDEFLI